MQWMQIPCDYSFTSWRGVPLPGTLHLCNLIQFSTDQQLLTLFQEATDFHDSEWRHGVHKQGGGIGNNTAPLGVL